MFFDEKSHDFLGKTKVMVKYIYFGSFRTTHLLLQTSSGEGVSEIKWAGIEDMLS